MIHLTCKVALDILEYTIKIEKNNYSYHRMYQRLCVCVCVQDPGPIAPLFMKQLLRVDCSLCALCWHR